MWLNYSQLQYFREIAQRGSIAEASRSLNVSSPALSKQLKTLEEQLGEKLFHREKKKLIMTSFGKYVLRYADIIFSTGEELLSNINNKLHENSFHVGVSSGLPKVITTKLIDHVNKNFPKVSILVTEGDDELLLKKINASECDLVFTDSPISFNNHNIESKNFLSSAIAIYGTKKFLNYSKASPSSLEGIPLLLPSVHTKLRYKIDQWFLDNHIHYKLVAELQDSGSKKILALSGTGSLVLSEVGARQLVDEKKIIKIFDLDGNEDFYYSVRTDYKSTIVSKIIEQLKDIWSV